MKFRLLARQILPEGIILPRPWRSKKARPSAGRTSLFEKRGIKSP